MVMDTQGCLQAITHSECDIYSKMLRHVLLKNFAHLSEQNHRLMLKYGSTYTLNFWDNPANTLSDISNFTNGCMGCIKG